MHTVLTCFITWLKSIAKSIGIDYCNIFFTELLVLAILVGLVLVLNIAILFTNIVNNPDN